MPPSIENTENSERFMRSKALNAKIVNAIPLSADHNAISNENGLNSIATPFIISSTINPAIDPIHEISMLDFSPLPRLVR